MYACVHIPATNPNNNELLQLALEFSPAVEQTSNDTVVFSIAALRKLIGSPHQIASEICRLGYERKIEANLAIASNPDTAILLACNCMGVILVTPGEERFKLGPLPLTCLFTHDTPVDFDLLAVLNRWGLKTCEELVALPERGIAERLGEAGIYLRNLACGKVNRSLSISALQTNYEERMELEHSIHLLEPLLFLLGRVLSELCGRLRSQSRAARTLAAHFELEQGKEYRCELEFPVPLMETAAMLKLLQLHLERHAPQAPIVAFTLRVEAAEPRRIQHGFFLPPTPPADKLQITLAVFREWWEKKMLAHQCC
jgi:nucleotidyltransferase/DNA polymerase involved in DNA repair